MHFDFDIDVVVVVVVLQVFALSLTLTLILSPFQIPTDAGVCHTFNGRPLDQLLKSSSWLTSFK